MPPLHPEHIEGWLSLEEAEFLQELATDKIVLEIGAYKGKSTVYLAGVAKKLYSLDWHYGTKGGVMGLGNDSLPVFRSNLRAAEVHNKVTILCGKTEDFDGLIRSSVFDMIFIDGDHSSKGVSVDTIFARKAVKEGGIICYHDWQMDSVHKTATPHFSGKTFQQRGSVGAFWV